MRSKQQRRGRWGLALLVAGLVYPAFLLVRGATIRRQPVAIALPTAEHTLTLPFRASTGTYLIRIEAAGGDFYSNPLRCILSLENPFFPSEQCDYRHSRLDFHYRLEDGRGTSVSDRYGKPIDGDYLDSDYSTFTTNNTMGAEFGWFDLKRGTYVLRLTNLEVPPELARAAPELQVRYQEDRFRAMEVFFQLIPCCLLLITGLVFLASAATNSVSD